jgi:hypothetical protein
MEKAISQLYNLPSDKQEGELFAEMLKKEIPVERNPLNVLVILKVLEKVIKDVLTDDALDAVFLKDFKEHAKDNKLLVNGATLIIQEFGSKYDYSTDPEWTTYDETIKTLSESKKAREKVLQASVPKTEGKLKVVVKS